jgi:ABC-type phosphate transport system auxiliary subunit
MHCSKIKLKQSGLPVPSTTQRFFLSLPLKAGNMERLEYSVSVLWKNLYAIDFLEINKEDMRPMYSRIIF